MLEELRRRISATISDSGRAMLLAFTGKERDDGIFSGSEECLVSASVFLELVPLSGWSKGTSFGGSPILTCTCILFGSR